MQRVDRYAVGTCAALLLVCLACAAAAGAAEPGAAPSNPASQGNRGKLVLELSFEGNAADTSAGKRIGVPKNQVSFADGRRGQCASFDGQSWIDTEFPQQELGDEFTVECWVNPSAQQSVHADVFGNHVSDGSGFVLQQDASDTNQFYAAYGAGGGRWVMTDAVPLAAGRWQHVALVKTREELRLYLNGVLVADASDPAPARPSPMPVAVGLGYTAPERCFRGLIDEFRIWNAALATFDHAGIDPEAARETRAQDLDSAPRPAAGPLAQTWTLANDDTRLTLGVTAAGELVVQELCCPAAGWNWIVRPVAFRLFPRVEAAGQSLTPVWRFVDAAVDETDGQKLTLRFACDDPALEAVSQWHARPGPGPIQHRLFVRNTSSQPVTFGEQPTFDLDVAGADTLWSFHSDGGTPDAVGVYRRPLADEPAGRRFTVRTAPNGEFIPLVVLDAKQQHGAYVGLEWSYCRIESLLLSGGESPVLRVRGGQRADLREELPPGATCEVRPGFIGAYRGDLDDAGNRLRRWLMRYRVPEVVRQDPSYPKVQWNAFGATGKTPGSWDPVEKKFYPLIDDIAPLGFEEVMIDVGWWQENEPDSDAVDWSSGMKRAADYAHAKGLRFGLYWTDNLDMASPAGREQRARRIERLFREYGADMWRSDCTRGEVLGSSFAATRGFYEMVDGLAQRLPGFQWENCSGGGRIKDFGAMSRAVKIFNSDTYSALHVRQGFYDSSFAFPPAQIEGHLGSTDGRFRPRGVAEMRYAFRSASLGAPEWFLDAPNGGNGCEPWTDEEKATVKACVDTYKTKLRPLVRAADLYHILPRPDGRNWDGIEYHDPTDGHGVVCLFKPAAEPATQTIRFKGLDAARTYRLTFNDGSQPPALKSGAELLDPGLPVTLVGEEMSELIFFEPASAVDSAVRPAAAEQQVEQWPEFRGPTGQGMSRTADVPDQWNATRVRWKVAVPGKGWSSPIVQGGRIFLTTAVPSPESPPQQQSLRAVALDAFTGRTLWNEQVFVKRMGPGEQPHAKNSFASPTPLTDGRHVFVHFGPDGTACLDRDGRRVWANDTLRYNPEHGAGGSPVFAGSLLVFHGDGAADPFVAALDRATGEIVWKTPRPETQSPTWSFATPLLIEADGRRQLISPAAHVVCSYDPDTGKELWRVRYPDKWSIIPRPVFAHGLVFVCTGYAGPAELLAIRPTGTGDVTESHVAWRIDDSVPHCPSLLVVGDDLFLVSDSGIASCRDARTGTLHWRERIGGSHSASPVHTAGRIFALSEQGVCTVFAAAHEYRELAVNDLQEPTLASLAIADGALFVRTERHVMRIE